MMKKVNVTIKKKEKKIIKKKNAQEKTKLDRAKKKRICHFNSNSGDELWIPIRPHEKVIQVD